MKSKPYQSTGKSLEYSFDTDLILLFSKNTANNNYFFSIQNPMLNKFNLLLYLVICYFFSLLPHLTILCLPSGFCVVGLGFFVVVGLGLYGSDSARVKDIMAQNTTTIKNILKNFIILITVF